MGRSRFYTLQRKPKMLLVKSKYNVRLCYPSQKRCTSVSFLYEIFKMFYCYFSASNDDEHLQSKDTNSTEDVEMQQSEENNCNLTKTTNIESEDVMDEMDSLVYFDSDNEDSPKKNNDEKGIEIPEIQF